MPVRITLILAFFCLFSFSLPDLVRAQNTETINAVNAESFDVQTPAEDNEEQVIDIEANVVQIVLNDEHRQGVDWGAIVSDFHTVNLKKEDNPIWQDKKYKISVGTVSEEDYAVLLDALDTVGRMSQYPQEPLKLLRNEKASMELKVGGDDHSQDIRLDLNSLSLRGENSLDIEPHMALLTSDMKNGQRVPVSLALKTKTEMPLKDKTVIMMGGLIREEEITKTHKFPFLGDLPLLGLVFRNQGRWMQKTETVIFLTVHMKENQEVDKANEGA